MSEPSQARVNAIAIALITEWNRVETQEVSVSYVATFVDLALVVARLEAEAEERGYARAVRREGELEREIERLQEELSQANQLLALRTWPMSDGNGEVRYQPPPQDAPVAAWNCSRCGHRMSEHENGEYGPSVGCLVGWGGDRQNGEPPCRCTRTGTAG